MKQILKVTEAANYIGVFSLTLRNWTRKGLIKSFRTAGGHRRFRKEDLDKIMYVGDDKLTLDKLKFARITSCPWCTNHLSYDSVQSVYACMRDECVLRSVSYTRAQLDGRV